MTQNEKAPTMGGMGMAIFANNLVEFRGGALPRTLEMCSLWIH
jgi:hypothetical protein